MQSVNIHNYCYLKTQSLEGRKQVVLIEKVTYDAVLFSHVSFNMLKVVLINHEV